MNFEDAQFAVLFFDSNGTDKFFATHIAQLDRLILNISRLDHQGYQ